MSETKSDYKWLLVTTSDYKWLRIRLEWLWVTTSQTRMTRNDCKWEQVASKCYWPSGYRWPVNASKTPSEWEAGWAEAYDNDIAGGHLLYCWLWAKNDQICLFKEKWHMKIKKSCPPNFSTFIEIRMQVDTSQPLGSASVYFFYLWRQRLTSYSNLFYLKTFSW